jgi:hypothetical protein
MINSTTLHSLTIRCVAFNNAQTLLYRFLFLQSTYENNEQYKACNMLTLI